MPSFYTLKGSNERLYCRPDLGHGSFCYLGLDILHLSFVATKLHIMNEMSGHFPAVFMPVSI